jgi:hypothetical protein
MPTPNLFQLSGRNHLHVTYSTSGIDGQPHLTYQDAHHTLSFRGTDQIRAVECDLGQVVSVTIRMTVDAGSTTFSFFMPRMNLPGHESTPIHTEGVTTVHRFSTVPAFNQGQLDTYNVVSLKGTAQFVVF